MKLIKYVRVVNKKDIGIFNVWKMKMTYESEEEYHHYMNGQAQDEAEHQAQLDSDEAEYLAAMEEPPKTEQFAEKFNEFLKKWCSDSYAHLVDSDENDAEELRLFVKENYLSKQRVRMAIEQCCHLDSDGVNSLLEDLGLEEP